MDVPLLRALVIGLFSGGTVSLILGAGGYWDGRDLLGRAATASGLCVFAIAVAIGASQYALNDRAYRVIAVPVSVLTILLCIRGVQLVYSGWARSRQLAVIVATFLLLVLPFELYPELHVLAQEWYARRTVTALGQLGARSTVGLAPGGHSTVVLLDNGFRLTIVRECNGIYAGALFTAIVVGARASVRRKLGGIAFALGAVFLVNQFRMIFVGLAIANDWFGPLLTDGNTVQMSYYVAELGVGQTLVVVAIVIGFLVLDRWIPDILDFFTELLSVNNPPTDGEL
jgi:archaeosortase A (PGF-CTERM-specific)